VDLAKGVVTVGPGAWLPVAEATTIGHKRILRIAGVEADRIRVIIEDATSEPALSTVGLYRASADDTVP